MTIVPQSAQQSIALHDEKKRIVDALTLCDPVVLFPPATVCPRGHSVRPQRQGPKRVSCAECRQVLSSPAFCCQSCGWLCSGCVLARQHPMSAATSGKNVAVVGGKLRYMTPSLDDRQQRLAEDVERTRAVLAHASSRGGRSPLAYRPTPRSFFRGIGLSPADAAALRLDAHADDLAVRRATAAEASAAVGALVPGRLEAHRARHADALERFVARQEAVNRGGGRTEFDFGLPGGSWESSGIGALRVNEG